MAEGDGDPPLPFRVVGPTPQLRGDRLLHRGIAPAPIFPREVAVPALPAYTRLARGTRLPGQAKIADRHHALSGARPVAVGERVELLDIAQRVVGLPFDPGAH